MGYLERLDSYRDEMIKVLGESVAFPSVAGEPAMTAEGTVMPFGRPAHDSLIHMLGVGTELGFESHNVDNYAGYIDYRASDEFADDAKTCAIVGHLDVVPVGGDWQTDPFTLTEKDEFLYGRGTSDDKGPVIASLYAMKALKEEGIPLKHNIRVILGLNEECGEESIEYYVRKCGHPDMGFTPDGNFPIVNGEMGIMVFELAQKFTVTPAKEDLRLTRMEGGIVHNAVPGEARAVIAGDKKYFELIDRLVKQYASETGFNISSRRQGSSLVIATKGIAAHGAHPQLGLNAVSIMMEFLGRVPFANEELNDFIRFYNDHIGFDLHGERFGVNYSDDPSGPLILNAGIANINEELGTVTVNIRYPVSVTDTDLISGMEKYLRDSNIGLITRMIQKPIYMPTDSDMVAKMIAAYQEETCDTQSKPITEAGGSYAKMVNNILCFGGQFPGDENTMHQANEKLRTDSFMKMARVYARALFKLCCE